MRILFATTLAVLGLLGVGLVVLGSHLTADDSASAPNPVPPGAWARWRTALESGRSVAWLEGDRVYPFARSGIIHSAPIATELRRVAIQNRRGGYIVEGGVVDVLEIDPACKLELYGAVSRYYNPDPTKALPSNDRWLHLFLVRRFSDGTGEIVAAGEGFRRRAINAGHAFVSIDRADAMIVVKAQHGSTSWTSIIRQELPVERLCGEQAAQGNAEQSLSRHPRKRD